MARFLVAFLLSVVPAFVAAQLGPGRFPCTQVNGDGSYEANQALCANEVLIAPGTSDPSSDAQGDQPAPVDSQCTLSREFGTYWCGMTGAACTTDANCDNGICVAGTCQGGFGQGCAGTDRYCGGYLYCLGPSLTPTATDTCGGVGAFCQDLRAGDLSLTVEQSASVYNQFCSTGYCDTRTAACEQRGYLNDDCSSDPQFKCATGLICDSSSYTCVDAPPDPSTQQPPTSTTTSAGALSTSSTTTTTSSSSAPTGGFGSGAHLDNGIYASGLDAYNVLLADGTIPSAGWGPDTCRAACEDFDPRRQDPQGMNVGCMLNSLANTCAVLRAPASAPIALSSVALRPDNLCNMPCADDPSRDRGCGGFDIDRSILFDVWELGYTGGPSPPFDNGASSSTSSVSLTTTTSSSSSSSTIEAATATTEAAPPPATTTPAQPGNGAYVGCAHLDNGIYAAGLNVYHAFFADGSQPAEGWLPETCRAACEHFDPRQDFDGMNVGCVLNARTNTCGVVRAPAAAPIPLSAVALRPDARCNDPCPADPSRTRGCGGRDDDFHFLFDMWELNYNGETPSPPLRSSSSSSSSSSSATTTTMSSTTPTEAPPATTTPAQPGNGAYVGCAHLNKGIYASGLNAYHVQLADGSIPAEGWGPETCRAACEYFDPRQDPEGMNVGCVLNAGTNTCAVVRAPARAPIALSSVPLRPDNLCNAPCPTDPTRNRGCGGVDDDQHFLFDMWELNYNGEVPTPPTSTAPPPATTTPAQPGNGAYIGCAHLNKGIYAAGLNVYHTFFADGSQPAEGWLPETCRAACEHFDPRQDFDGMNVGCVLHARTNTCGVVRAPAAAPIPLSAVALRPDARCNDACPADPSRTRGCGGVDDDLHFLFDMWELNYDGETPSPPFSDSSSSSSSSSSTSSSSTVTSAPASSSTPFRVNGAVSTTKIIEAPIMLGCASSQVYANCLWGAQRANSCCRSDPATCQAIYDANRQNCEEVGQASYPCLSTADSDMEECCTSIFSAFFTGGGEGVDACAGTA
ncbi:hypothetical protein JCM6882_009097 [Rhodosporidiobolus microsporus]